MPTVAQPTRKQRRDAARRERIEREAALAAAAARRRRLTLLGALLGVAAVVVAVLIAVSTSGSKTAASTAAPGPVSGAREANALFAGIPQHGLVLGNAKAPVRIVEFADLQCPFCSDYSLSTMPGLVDKYVRTGKASMEFRSLAFIGPDSVRAARVAQAAGQQDKLWNFVDVVYRNQGKENTGWATDAVLKRLASGAGVDANRAFAARNSTSVTNALNAANTLATQSGVQSTPTFLVGRGSNLKAVDAAGLPAAIKAAVGS